MPAPQPPPAGSSSSDDAASAAAAAGSKIRSPPRAASKKCQAQSPRQSGPEEGDNSRRRASVRRAAGAGLRGSFRRRRIGRIGQRRSAAVFLGKGPPTLPSPSAAAVNATNQQQPASAAAQAKRASGRGGRAVCSRLRFASSSPLRKEAERDAERAGGTQDLTPLPPSVCRGSPSS